MKANNKFVALILRGAAGDLFQDRDCSFCYVGSTDALVLVGETGLTLTPAGAEFILENLYSERTPSELAWLTKMARGA